MVAGNGKNVVFADTCGERAGAAEDNGDLRCQVCIREVPFKRSLLKYLPSFPTLQVLSCLQLLGRGNVFQDIYHMSWMSMQTAAATFHRFCKHFAAELYDEHIFLPTGAYQDKVMADYARIGFTGAVGSTDVTHLPWGMCPYNQARSHTGKEGFPTLAYQVTVSHTKRVLAVTPGFTGSTNDKTIIRFDGAVTKIRTDPIYTDRTYKLYRRDGTPFETKGCYLLVDNGYHKVR